MTSNFARLQVSNVNAFAAVGMCDRSDIANHSFTRGKRQPLAEPAFGRCVVALACWRENVAFLTRHRAGFVVMRFVGTYFNRVGIVNRRDEWAAFLCAHTNTLTTLVVGSGRANKEHLEEEVVTYRQIWRRRDRSMCRFGM